MSNSVLANVEAQIARLHCELSDLEEMREELDDEEYETSKAEALVQLEEFTASLAKLQGAAAAPAAAIVTGSAVATAKNNEKAGIRSRVAVLEADCRLGKITRKVLIEEAGELLQSLSKIDELSPLEKTLLLACTNRGETGVEVGGGESVKMSGERLLRDVRDAL